jgi:predicted short-subunit dehydrogenase-like oxidoreductase (DUF2520 family)
VAEPRVVVIGRGKLGRALASELSARGVEVSLQAGTRMPPGQLGVAHTRASRAIFVLAVPDGAIAGVAARIASQLGRGAVALHCAGARGPDELAACARQGVATGVLHPLVSFASPHVLPPLAGAAFVAQGAPAALRAARWLCKKLEAEYLPAPIIGPAYHAAAALLANGGAALAYSAQQILVELGVPARRANRALAGLLASVAFNVRALGVPRALTGPVSRGDVATVRAHTRALKRLSPELARQYRQMQPIIAACARAQHAARAQRQR